MLDDVNYPTDSNENVPNNTHEYSGDHGSVSCHRMWSVKAHGDRVTGLAVHPGVNIRQGPTEVHYCTACADGSAALLDGTGKALHRLGGADNNNMNNSSNSDDPPKARLGRCAFHPSGRVVGTACFDTTWKVWDVERGQELYEQEGHSRAVYTVAFHPDGSLAATGGLDSIVRVWDLRTGRTAL